MRTFILRVESRSDAPEATLPSIRSRWTGAVRSERAMILALAEMDMQGVSTRKVTAIVSDDHAGLRAARQAVLAGVPWSESLRPLASAVLSEISDDWETELASLTMEAK